jgi:hypothetical protein
MSAMHDLTVIVLEMILRLHARHLDRRMRKIVIMFQESLPFHQKESSCRTLQSAKKESLISVQKERRTVIHNLLRLRRILMKVSVAESEKTYFHFFEAGF